MTTAPTSVPARALTALGALGVVLGGLVAAVTGPMDWAKGSWAAAYLVLVVGVAQHVMGRLRAVDATDDRAGWVQLAGWNLGSALVIGGTLVTTPLLVDLGSVLLVVALVLALRAGARGPGDGIPRVVGLAYRAMLLVLAVSIPVGMLLSHLRS
ncbi:hypothetical protein ASG73_05425 [Janibacter sp. Soil728]|uniref:hypothetical protein n=1 Tax=Janibacter sp. Soil728 TaxID=1736393 RepID=UPI0007021D68|nr:hypothetical protein [Janibacter sp. Soil728]KRE38388.1 hypothetical protein ASG73_05425 [Janibacter sp. Soil728]